MVLLLYIDMGYMGIRRDPKNSTSSDIKHCQIDVHRIQHRQADNTLLSNIDEQILHPPPTHIPNQRSRLILPLPRSLHLRIPLLLPPPPMKPALPPPLLLRRPLPQPHQPLHDQKDDDYPRRDAQNIARQRAPPIPRVEEVIHVDAAGVVRQVRQREVEGEDEDQCREMQPRRAVRARDDELEEGEERVEGVLGEVGPAGVGGGEPGAVEDGPVDDGDEEGVGEDGGVEEGVQGLEGAREAREKGGAVARVGEGVDAGEEEVEGEPPIS